MLIMQARITAIIAAITLNIMPRKRIYCKCGCKEKVKPGNTYIYCHQNRNKHRPQELRDRISKALTGRKQSSEINLKRSETLKGRTSPNKGNILSDESKRKIGDASKRHWKNPKYREVVTKKIGDAHRGMKRSEEAKRKMSESHKGVKLSKKVRENMSLSQSKKYLDGFTNYYNSYKCGYFYSKKNGRKLHYRSSYELAAYEILEQLSKVKSYEGEPFRVAYKWKGIKHNTIPDILINYTDGSKELIEVKPKNMLEDEQNLIKFKAMDRYAKKNDMDFNVWTEKELNLFN